MKVSVTCRCMALPTILKISQAMAKDSPILLVTIQLRQHWIQWGTVRRGAGYAEPIYNEGVPGNLVGTNGKLQVFNAIGFGFKRTFSNAKLWLLGSLAFVIFFLIIGGIVGVFFGPDYSQTSGSVQVGTDWASNIVGLISLLLMPFIYRLATKEVDSRATGWASIGKDVHYFPTIIITLILWAVGMVFSFLFIDQILGRFIAEVEAAGTDDTAVYNAMAENLGGFLGASLLILIGSVLLSPLYQLMVWYAADGRGGIGQAISQGLKTGVSNYFTVAGFQYRHRICNHLYRLRDLRLGNDCRAPSLFTGSSSCLPSDCWWPCP